MRPPFLGGGMCPEQMAIIRQRVELLKKEIAGLPPKQQQVTLMRLEGDTFRDIANELNCPYNTAKANFRHAVTNLRIKMRTVDDLPI